MKPMRTRSLGWLMMGLWLGAVPATFPLPAHAADYMTTARASLKKGDLKAAQIDLRNAVRADPQNAEAHYWLGRVNFELGDPVASQREALAARPRLRSAPGGAAAGPGAAGTEQV
jgi:predicted Zn-dependent protease